MVETAKESRGLEEQVREVNVTEAAQKAWARLGETSVEHTAVTLLKQPLIRAVLMVMRSGSKIPEHTANGDLTLQVLKGKIRFRVDQKEIRMSQGQLLTVGGNLPHDLEADEDAELILTIAMQPSKG
jgi:quercetin dioxygenase-like cupin family protein